MSAATGPGPHPPAAGPAVECPGPVAGHLGPPHPGRVVAGPGPVVGRAGLSVDHPEPAAGRPGPAPVHAGPVAGSPEPVAGHPGPAPVHPGPVAGSPGPVAGRPGSPASHPGSHAGHLGAPAGHPGTVVGPAGREPAAADPGHGRSLAGEAGPVPAAVLRARAYLSRVAEPPAPALAELVAAVGAEEAAARVRSGEVPEAVALETRARRGVDRSAADLAAARAAGVRLVVPEHPDWPAAAFTALAGCGVAELAPPVALWVRGPGRLAALTERAVALVGARAATAYGAHVAADLGAGLAALGHTVVSGAAIGVDGAAHRGALGVAGATVAVLACGADRVYPLAHEALLARIGETGLVVSEYPPGSVPGRHRFLVRNRLIAALAAGTVVVEAGLRSGAARTAADAATLGRPVMAVPGPVTSAQSAGCHRLLREGAELVTRTEEVLEALGPLGAVAPEEPPGPRRATDGLDPVGLRVHDALPARDPRAAAWLALEAGVPVGAVRASLLDLERRGLVRQADGLWQRRPERRRAGGR